MGGRGDAPQRRAARSAAKRQWPLGHPLGHRLGSVTSQIGAIPENLIREFLKGSTALKVPDTCAPKPSIQQVSSAFLYNPLRTQ